MTPSVGTTLGDGYQAAAFLSGSGDTSKVSGQDGDADAAQALLGTRFEQQERQRQHEGDAEICRSVVCVAGALVEVVKRISKERGLEHLSCRCGVASGTVIAGMLGKLQPRFQLLGEPVYLAQKLENAGEVNSVNVCSETQSFIKRWGHPKLGQARAEGENARILRRNFH